jgi:large subunit ribosomal protein L21
MYAIVETSGTQFSVSEGTKIKVDRQETEVGKEITFGSILMLKTDTDILVGTPYVTGASITAKVLAHDRAKKLVVFKKKRRKGFMKKKGHRQDYTEVLIEKITVGA